MNAEIECCRICLCQHFDGQSIFEPYYEKFLPEIVQIISGVLICHNDGMTSKVCFKCAQQLLQAQDIRQKCIDSDTFLRAYFKFDTNVLEGCKNSSFQCNENENQYDGDDNNKRNDGTDLEAELDEYLKTVGERSCESQDDNENNYEDIPLDEEGQERNVMKCGHCSKKYLNQIAFKRHLKYHNQEKTKCPICPREFTHKSNLKRHLSIHKDKDELICDKCGKVFSESRDLYDHLKSHKNMEDDREEYILECEKCKIRTASLATYLSHMKEKHEVDVSKPFKCRICEMKFASKQGMYRHIDNIHENNRRNLRNRDKNFLCNTCGKNFYTNFHLQVHFRSHTGEKPFKCEYCDKSFSQLSGLKMHTFIHTGEKPFACKICGKKFNQYGHVRGHLLTHSDERSHVCKICGHPFRIKGNLTAHMMIHTGKKSLSCNICGKYFNQQIKLEDHIQKFHTQAEENQSV